MAQAAVAAEVHQAFDVRADLAAEVTLDLEVVLDARRECVRTSFSSSSSVRLAVRYTSLVEDLLGAHVRPTPKI